MEFYGTLGPACAHRETLAALFRAGMTGVRLNLSHATLAQCAPLLSAFRAAAEEAEVSGPRLVLDLQGPELRLGMLEAPVPLAPEEEVLLGPCGIPIPPQVAAVAQAGGRIALDDSALLLSVQAVTGPNLRCKVLRGGVLRSRKSLALLDGPAPSMPALTGEDLENLAQAAALGVTDILQPFVRGGADLRCLRDALAQAGLPQARVIAKIENAQGLERLDEIIAGADMVCIARGDLGNAIPLWELPPLQARIAARCRRAGKPFLVVTQLLWSMEQRAVPTRAEVNDIYHAVLSGAQALMLTGETAAGCFPVEAMDYLVRTARRALRDLEPHQT